MPDLSTYYGVEHHDTSVNGLLPSSVLQRSITVPLAGFIVALLYIYKTISLVIATLVAVLSNGRLEESSWLHRQANSHPIFVREQLCTLYLSNAHTYPLGQQLTNVRRLLLHLQRRSLRQRDLRPKPMIRPHRRYGLLAIRLILLPQIFT